MKQQTLIRIRDQNLWHWDREVFLIPSEFRYMEWDLKTMYDKNYHILIIAQKTKEYAKSYGSGHLKTTLLLQKCNGLYFFNKSACLFIGLPMRRDLEVNIRTEQARVHQTSRTTRSPIWKSHTVVVYIMKKAH